MMATHTKKEVHRESDSSCQSADDVKDLLVQTPPFSSRKRATFLPSLLYNTKCITHFIHSVEATVHYAPSQYLSRPQHVCAARHHEQHLLPQKKVECVNAGDTPVVEIFPGFNY